MGLEFRGPLVSELFAAIYMVKIGVRNAQFRNAIGAFN
jgi:hypothetical protein